MLPRPVIKNIIEVVHALLLISTGSRGWYGRLTLWGIARAMTMRTTVKARRKRLSRFLSNKRFDVEAALQALVTFSGIQYWGSMVPVLLDQTSLCKDAVQAIFASFVHNNRGVPIDLCTFEGVSRTESQNTIEWRFIKGVIERLRTVIIPIIVMDRGYAKLTHIKDLARENALFIIRGCRNVIVEYGDAAGSQRLSLGRLRHTQGKAVRYRNVKYRDDGVQIVDIIVYRGYGFQEPWFLVVPSGREDMLPTEAVVQWYRWRMRIETTFRDFKSCLGARKGLLFTCDHAVRMSRIMICLTITYMILLAVSATGEARRVRKNLEVRRRKSRHGTRRTLSALTIALLAIENLLRSNTKSLEQLFIRLFDCWNTGLFSPAFDSVVL